MEFFTESSNKNSSSDNCVYDLSVESNNNFDLNNLDHHDFTLMNQMEADSFTHMSNNSSPQMNDMNVVKLTVYLVI